MFFTDDGIARKCYSVAEGLAKYLPKADILNVFPIMIEGDDPSDADIDRFLLGFKELARGTVKQWGPQAANLHMFQCFSSHRLLGSRSSAFHVESS